jgi:hypothetical protein
MYIIFNHINGVRICQPYLLFSDSQELPTMDENIVCQHSAYRLMNVYKLKRSYFTNREKTFFFFHFIPSFIARLAHMLTTECVPLMVMMFDWAVLLRVFQKNHHYFLVKNLILKNKIKH